MVLNYLNRHTIHPVEDVEVPPAQYAEQFVDPDPARAIPSEELLRQARMIIATELGIDPILRDEIRKLFKTNALISVEPTEKGKAKIDDHHPFYVRYEFSFDMHISHVARLLELQIFA